MAAFLVATGADYVRIAGRRVAPGLILRAFSLARGWADLRVGRLVPAKFDPPSCRGTPTTLWRDEYDTCSQFRSFLHLHGTVVLLDDREWRKICSTQSTTFRHHKGSALGLPVGSRRIASRHHRCGAASVSRGVISLRMLSLLFTSSHGYRHYRRIRYVLAHIIPPSLVLIGWPDHPRKSSATCTRARSFHRCLSGLLPCMPSSHPDISQGGSSPAAGGHRLFAKVGSRDCGSLLICSSPAASSAEGSSAARRIARSRISSCSHVLLHPVRILRAVAELDTSTADRVRS